MGTPLPPVANTIRARFVQSVGDDANVENIMYFQYNALLAPLTPANALSLANSLMSTWSTALSGMFVPTTALNQVVVTDLDTATGVEQTSTHAAVPGTSSGASATAGVCQVVTVNTPLRGRSYRGRIYFSGMPASDLTDPQHWSAGWTAGTTTNMATWAGLLNALASPGPLTGAVVSFFSGKTPNPNPNSRLRFIPTRRVTPLSTSPVTYTAKSRVASQRRRNS